MPGANARALEKAQSLNCDAIIFDLEDAVAPASKVTARAQVAAAISGGGYGYRELIVRVNSLETPWGQEDLETVANLSVDALLFPKVESAKQVQNIVAAMTNVTVKPIALWLMIETPKGVLDVRSIANASERIAVLVMGTSDLVKEQRARHTRERHNISYALQHCVLAAREQELDILDGVHLDFRDLESFAAACQQGVDLGFDGKTLIHPSQIEGANAAFGPDLAAVDHAQRLLAVWQRAQADGRGVAELDGQLVENLHAAEAERVIAFAQALASR